MRRPTGLTDGDSAGPLAGNDPAWDRERYGPPASPTAPELRHVADHAGFVAATGPRQSNVDRQGLTTTSIAARRALPTGGPSVQHHPAGPHAGTQNGPSKILSRTVVSGWFSPAAHRSQAIQGRPIGHQHGSPEHCNHSLTHDADLYLVRLVHLRRNLPTP